MFQRVDLHSNMVLLLCLSAALTKDISFNLHSNMVLLLLLNSTIGAISTIFTFQYGSTFIYKHQIHYSLNLYLHSNMVLLL